MNGILGLLKSVSDPMALVQQMALTDPRMREVMKVIQENNGDAKAAFYRVASQRGVNPDEVLDMVKKMM